MIYLIFNKFYYSQEFTRKQYIINYHNSVLNGHLSTWVKTHREEIMIKRKGENHRAQKTNQIITKLWVLMRARLFCQLRTIPNRMTLKIKIRFHRLQMIPISRQPKPIHKFMIFLKSYMVYLQGPT